MLGQVRLTSDLLTRFVGGDLEVHLGPGPITDAWRGPIQKVGIVDDVLDVECDWMAFLPQGSMQWKKAEKKQYRFPLADYAIQQNRERLIFSHKNGPEKGLIVFFPPGRNLDPKKVTGF